VTEKPDKPHGAAWPFRSLREILPGLMLDRRSLKPGDEADFDPRPKSMAQKATASISAAFSRPLCCRGEWRGVDDAGREVRNQSRATWAVTADRIVSEGEAAGFATYPAERVPRTAQSASRVASRCDS
jgi:hypothetical protein